MGAYTFRNLTAQIVPYAICISASAVFAAASLFLLPSSKSLDNIVENVNSAEAHLIEQRSSAAVYADIGKAIVGASIGLALSLPVTSCVLHYLENRKRNRSNSVHNTPNEEASKQI